MRYPAAVTGIAVPWDSPVKIRDWWLGETYFEQVARGAVQDSDDAKLYAEHRDIIGRVVSHRGTDEGWEITARISETARGNDVYALLRDGALDRVVDATLSLLVPHVTVS